MADADARPPDGTLADPTDIAQLREGINALQSGDRTGAHTIFSTLVQRAYRDVNAWLGLALSSDEPAEAFGALRNARLVQPDNPFVANAAAELARRWPDEAAREEAVQVDAAGLHLPGSMGTPATEAPEEPDAIAGGARLESGQRPALTTTPRRNTATLQRGATFVLLGVVFLALVGAFVVALQNAGVIQGLRPPEPTATLTPLPTLPPPAVHIPPTVVAPTSGPAGGTPSPFPTLTPSSAALARQGAIQAVQAGQFGQAVPLLEQITTRDPQDTEALYYLGLAYLNAPDRADGPTDGLLAFRSVTAQRPDWAPGLQMLAEAFMRQQPPQYRDAVPAAHRAVEVDPMRADYWVTLGRAYEGAGDTNSATQAYAEAARHAPAPPPPPPTPVPTATPTATETPAPVPSGAPEVGTPTPATPLPTGTPGTVAETPDSGAALPGTVVPAGTPATETPASGAPLTATTVPTGTPATGASPTSITPTP